MLINRLEVIIKMKKVICGFFLLLFVMLPINVFALGSVDVSSKTLTVVKGKTATFDIVVTNAAGFGNISSENTNIATVSSNYLDTGTSLEGKEGTFPITVTGVSVGVTNIKIDIYDMTSYDAESLEKVLTVKVNVVAEAEKYTITYNGNGGTLTKNNDIVEKGSSVTLPSVTKNNFKFLGWYTALTGGNFAGVAGATYKPETNITLYARWEALAAKTYTVTYHANTGTGVPNPQVKEENKELILSTVKPTKEKFVFDGWNTEKNGTGTSYQPGGRYTLNEDVTLYAQWKTPATVDKNPDTGDSAIFIILAIALTLGGYSYWYTKKSKES